MAHNPAAGFLFNANNANVPEDREAIFGRDWEESFRAKRIEQFMDTIDKHSLDTSAMMQADRVSLAALAMNANPREDRATTTDGEQALRLIARRNDAADKDRPVPPDIQRLPTRAARHTADREARRRHRRTGPDTTPGGHDIAGYRTSGVV